MGFWCLALAAASGVAGATSVVSLRGSDGLDVLKSAAAMQPTQAARTLSRVENEWRSQALQFVECQANAGHSDCGALQGTFRQSCGTVVSAVVSASSGNRDTVKDYMAIVCGEPQLQGWQQERCQSFAGEILNTMSADNYENRERLNLGGLCTNFWAKMYNAEAARVVREHNVQEKQLAAERARKQKEAERAAAAAERKRMKEAAAAERQAAEAQHQEKERRFKAEMAARAAARDAAAKAAKAAAEQRAAKKAAEKAAAEKKQREAEAKAAAEKDTMQKMAEAEAAEAEAKLKEAERDEEETKQKLADAEAAKTAKAAKTAAPAKPAKAAKAEPLKAQTGKPTAAGSKPAPPKAAAPVPAAQVTQTSQSKAVATSKA